MGETIDHTPALRTLSQVPDAQLTLPDLDAMELADLDGWEPADLLAWLREAVPKLAVAERVTEAMRRATGLFLWKLRVDLGDGAYGTTVSDLATEVGVTVRTMGRWRTAAEEHYSLPPPSKRTIAQRERRALPSAETSNQGKDDDSEAASTGAVQGSDKDGAAAAGPEEQQPAAKAADELTQESKPATVGTGGPSGARPQPPTTDPAPPPSDGFPMPRTAAGVRHLVTMVGTIGRAQIAHSFKGESIAAVVDAHEVLDGVLWDLKGGTTKRIPLTPRTIVGNALSLRPAAPPRQREVTTLFKGNGKR